MPQTEAEGDRGRSADGAPGVLVRWVRGHRRTVLLAFSLLLLLAMLGVAEGSLRLAGYGGYPRTFRAAGTLADGSTLVFTDPAGPASYFFANRSEGMALDIEALVSPKPAGTFRVMLVGESAAKGIPEPRPLRAASFLREMLADAWPGRRVEVINLGTPGIASYPVLGVMTEALDYEPDLVVAYLGNNEFYGAYGVASLHTAGRSPVVIRVLRAFHSTAIAQALSGMLSTGGVRRSGTLMEAMVGRSSIGPNDPARAAAAHTLETFVGEMIDRCRARGAPIVVCLPACNESGMAPLGEISMSRVDPAVRPELERSLRLAAERIDAAPDGAEAAARGAIALCGQHATAHFLLGRALARQGRSEEAAAAFRRAVDLDPMPWRPPATSVAAIRRAADARGAPVADLESAFRAASAHGSIGWDLMDDHVHPTLCGQALVARTIVRAMQTLPGQAAVKPAVAEALPDWRVYAARLGANDCEVYAVATRMRRLGEISFFRRTNPEMGTRNEEICRAIEGRVAPEVVTVLREWAESRSDRVDRYPASAAAGRALLESGHAAEAESLLRFAAAAADPYSSWRIEFVCLALLAKKQAAGGLEPGDLSEAAGAIEQGTYLIDAGHSRTGGAELWCGRLHLLRGEPEAAIRRLRAACDKLPRERRVLAEVALVEAYRAAGRGAEARALLQEGLRGPQAPAFRAAAAE